ncbi:MAG: NAD-dependent epimerase/dehydratase family protein [Myxococcota bacterium]
MRVLLTGAAGFIGSHVAERLLGRGDEVVGFDNFDPFYDRRDKERNLDGFRGRITFVEGDVRDGEALDALFDAHGPFDGVIHFAALAGVRPSIAEPARYQDVNVTGLARLCETMRRHNCLRLAFASSSSVYGDNDEVPYREDHPVVLPASPYAASKRAGELLLRTYATLYGMNVSCLRFFTVYGPRQRPEMAIHKFCRRVAAGRPITMFGDGSTSRDYTFVDDIVAGTVAAFDRAPDGHQIYNLGNTEPVALRDLIAAVGVATGKTPIVEELPLQPGDVMHTWADVSRARDHLGYAPTTSLAQGLERFVTWMRAHPE